MPRKPVSKRTTDGFLNLRLKDDDGRWRTVGGIFLSVTTGDDASASDVALAEQHKLILDAGYQNIFDLISQGRVELHLNDLRNKNNGEVEKPAGFGKSKPAETPAPSAVELIT